MGELAFEALVLYRESRLTVEAARSFAELSRAGIPVLFVGRRPEESQGYLDHASRDRLVRDTMASMPGEVCPGGAELEAALERAGVRPEIRYDGALPRLGFIHRTDREDGSEYYFLRSRSREEQNASIGLEGAGKVPVLLDLWSGRTGTLAHTPTSAGVTLTLRFAGYESKMVALLPPDAGRGLPEATEPVMGEDLESLLELRGFRFHAELRQGDGTVRRVEMTLEEPVDWRQVPGLAGLSNPGTYGVDFAMPGLDPGRRVFLDLQRVCDRADVVLNGTIMEPLLVPPWRRELTGLLRQGSNSLNIRVTPTLRNCLVAYGSSGSKAHRQYRKQPTMPSGLIGPVRVCVTKLTR
jgi:hypothetical protein